MLVQKTHGTQLGNENIVVTSHAHHLEANLNFDHVAQVEDIRLASLERRSEIFVGMDWLDHREWQANSPRFLWFGGQGTLPIVHVVLRCMSLRAKKGPQDVEGINYPAKIFHLLSLSLLG